ncbi:MAG: ABC transporter substrate-binding protein [bacterium]|nr:ABC transporter substrate-binding protein [bacterium]
MGNRKTILSFILFFGLFCHLLNARDNSGIGCDSIKFPHRIVSLGPAITEEIYLLGAEDRLVANTIYCERPPEAKKKEKIGTVIEINVEKIISFKPDLVLATPLTDPKAKEKLKNLGLKVVTFPVEKDFNEICRNFLELGQIIGKKEEAEKIIYQVKNEVDSISKKIKTLSKLEVTPPKVFIQVGANPLFTVTKDSFLNDLIGFAGGVNIALGAKTGLYSREKVIQQNPDVIIIVTMGIVGEKEMKSWQRYKTLNAVKNNRIYIMDSYKVCSPTPISFVEALEELVKILH